MLKKKHNEISYHCMHEAQAASIIRIAKEWERLDEPCRRVGNVSTGSEIKVFDVSYTLVMSTIPSYYPPKWRSSLYLPMYGSRLKSAILERLGYVNWTLLPVADNSMLRYFAGLCTWRSRSHRASLEPISWWTLCEGTDWILPLVPVICYWFRLLGDRWAIPQLWITVVDCSIITHIFEIEDLLHSINHPYLIVLIL